MFDMMYVEEASALIAGFSCNQCWTVAVLCSAQALNKLGFDCSYIVFDLVETLQRFSHQ